MVGVGWLSRRTKVDETELKPVHYATVNGAAAFVLSNPSDSEQSEVLLLQGKVRCNRRFSSCWFEHWIVADWRASGATWSVCNEQTRRQAEFLQTTTSLKWLVEIAQAFKDYQKTQFGGWPWPDGEHQRFFSFENTVFSPVLVLQRCNGVSAWKRTFCFAEWRRNYATGREIKNFFFLPLCFFIEEWPMQMFLPLCWFRKRSTSRKFEKVRMSVHFAFSHRLLLFPLFSNRSRHFFQTQNFAF